MEIKLRCWSIRKQKMYYPTEFRVKFNRDGEHFVLLCDGTNQHYEKKNSFVLMLWTGLTVNGQDIYDGDIAVFSDGMKAPIYYRNDWASFVVDHYTGEAVRLLELKFKKYNTPITGIAGNIYEQALA